MDTAPDCTLMRPSKNQTQLFSSPSFVNTRTWLGLDLIPVEGVLQPAAIPHQPFVSAVHLTSPASLACTGEEERKGLRRIGR